MLTAPFAEAMARDGRWARIGDVAPRQFQVLGERASGTNVIRKLVELNTDLRHTEGLGWKHGFPQMVAIPPACLVICAVRAPEPWALSMHRRPWHAHPELQAMGFSEFIRAEWRSVMDGRGHFGMLAGDLRAKGAPLQLDRHPITGRAFDTIFALRSAKLASLAGMVARGCSVAYVQMDRATADPDPFLDWISGLAGRARSGPLHVPERRMGHRFRRASEPVDTPERMSLDDRAFMKSALDATIERSFGYEMP